MSPAAPVFNTVESVKLDLDLIKFIIQSTNTHVFFKDQRHDSKLNGCTENILKQNKTKDPSHDQHHFV